jgi:hypothetical protein
MPNPIINTAKAERRKLKFSTLDEILVEAEGIAAAERAGRLRRTGNWTTGQTFSHLAAFMNYAFDGYPPELSNPPWFIKVLLRFRKKAMLRDGLPAGVRIPGLKAGTVGVDNISTDEGLARLRREIQRLNIEAPSKPNPIFGPMPHEQWKTLHLRHAELHLGFLHP